MFSMNCKRSFKSTSIYQMTCLIHILQRNWVFATNSIFLIHLSLEPDVANLWYFKHSLLQTQILSVRATMMELSLFYITNFYLTDLCKRKERWICQNLPRFWTTISHCYNVTWNEKAEEGMGNMHMSWLII